MRDLAEQRAVLAELERSASLLGVEVVIEPMEETRGGLCLLYGRHLLYVNSAMPVVEQVEVFARALARFSTEHLYLRPRVRALLERYSTSTAG